MKMAGAEWREFEKTGWPEGYIWADESCLDSGRDIDDEPPADDEVFIVQADWGMVRESGPVHPKENADGDGMNVRAMIRAWRKARDTETIIVEVKKADAARAREMIAAEGWKIV